MTKKRTMLKLKAQIRYINYLAYFLKKNYLHNASSSKKCKLHTPFMLHRKLTFDVAPK